MSKSYAKASGSWDGTGIQGKSGGTWQSGVMYQNYNGYWIQVYPNYAYLTPTTLTLSHTDTALNDGNEIGFEFRRDGRYRIYSGGVGNLSIYGDWCTNRFALVGDFFEFRFTPSGIDDNGTNFAENVWTTIDKTLWWETFYQSGKGDGAQVAGTVEIRQKDTGTIVSTITIDLYIDVPA